MDKVENMQEQMGSVSGERKILFKKRKYRDKKHCNSESKKSGPQELMGTAAVRIPEPKAILATPQKPKSKENED